MRIKLVIEYIGTAYNGWQSQTNGNTVQDKVESALSSYFGGQTIRIYGAGRTDVGVHATGQIAHFDIDKPVNVYKLCLGVNIYLPSDIAVRSAEVVEDDFDARFWADSKTYRYRLYVSATRRPMLDINHCQVYRPLDIAKMREAAKLLVGTHDFKNFQNSGSNLIGTVRTLNSVELLEKSDNIIELVVNGNAFLYNMVRLIAGTLVAVGSGKLDVNDVATMLDANCNRVKHVRTLPSRGLTLEQVYYAKDGKRKGQP